MTDSARPDIKTDSPLNAAVELHRYADRVLGERNWFVLSNYGRVMSGQHSGSYVSGIPTDVARAFVDALVRGEQVPVHLMHRHESGNYESSSLHLRHQMLVLIFADREELA